MTEEDLEQSSRSYLELEKRTYVENSSHAGEIAQNHRKDESRTADVGSGMVDVVLSDMSEPFPQTEGFWKRSLSDPYCRMMNVSGVGFRDHAGSMVKSNDHHVYTRKLTEVYDRICVTLHYALLPTPYALAATSSANFIKALRIRLWRCG